MSESINNIANGVVSTELQKVIKNQKYLNPKTFFNIGGSSLGVWLFNSIGAGMVENFVGAENYGSYNCDAWLQLTVLAVSIIIAFVGVHFTGGKTIYHKFVAFFTGLMIFFCATSVNTYTSHFFKTAKNTEAQTQMGLLPFRNPSWFPPQALVEEVKAQEKENTAKTEKQIEFANYVEELVQQSPGSTTEKTEILGNVENYKKSVEKPRQATQSLSAIDAKTQKQNAVEFEKQGFNAIISQNFDLALNSFQKAYQAWDIYHNVDEINQLLQSRKDKFTQSDTEQKNAVWREIYCEIALKYQWGMSADIRSQFQQTLKSKNYLCTK